MKTINYKIKDELGIHARPAGLLMAAAKRFSSTVTIAGNGKNADARNVMDIMRLGIKEGNEVTVMIDGDDEDLAVLEIEEFFRNHL